MTFYNKYRLHLCALMFVAMGIFTGFPYFMQPPPLPIHDHYPWAVGMLFAACFFVAGMLVERIWPRKMFL